MFLTLKSLKTPSQNVNTGQNKYFSKRNPQPDLLNLELKSLKNQKNFTADKKSYCKNVNVNTIK